MSAQKLGRTKIKIGLTILVGLVVFFIFIILIGTDDYLFSKTFNLYAYINNTAGLVKGGPVTLGGYKIGDIESIEFIHAGNGEVIRVKLRILEDYKKHITKSSRAVISSIGILGDKFVDISVGKANEKALAENSTIPVFESIGLENIASELKPGVDNLKKILQNISSVSDSISSGQGSISSLINRSATVDGLNNVIKKADRLLTSIQSEENSLGKFLTDKELYDNLNSVTVRLKQIIDNTQSGKGTLGKLANDDSLYNNINSSAEQLSKILVQAQDSSTVVGSLLNDRELYNNVNDLIKQLNMLIVDIRENPDRYVNVSVF
ncbi:MAG: MlaD family protein [Ignavibacteria bacterium]|jgi:phospholipid/cholesterol/gamma-HCH transport system substrate-binding protein